MGMQCRAIMPGGTSAPPGMQQRAMQRTQVGDVYAAADRVAVLPQVLAVCGLHCGAAIPLSLRSANVAAITCMAVRHSTACCSM